MIECRKLCAVPIEDAYEAFSLGYSDYLIPMRMSREQFAERFFGPEGNDPALSFVAYDESRPIGIILGGIRTMDGIRTMRCGTFCIAPESRGAGTGRLLFARHRAAAEEAGCRQLFLEVLTNNARAIRFYEATGYRSGYFLKFYSQPGPFPRPAGDAPLAVREMPFSAWEACRAKLPDVHINWQSDVACFSSGDWARPHVFGAEAGGAPVALAALTPQGRVYFLWVDRAPRLRGLGRWLLHEASQALQPEKLTVFMPNNAVLEGFLRTVGFERDAIELYEMFLPL